MRKITKTVCGAFINGTPKSMRNTSTDGVSLFLHGNKIAEKRNGEIWVTLAGWPTVTTRDRINGVARCLGMICFVHQSRNVQHLNGKPWDGGWAKACELK
jgi:hypothetical protein